MMHMESPRSARPNRPTGTLRAAQYIRLDGAVDWVHSQTAGFCQDHQGPKEFYQPRSRVVTRFVFTVAVCLLAVLLVLLFLFTEESTFRTARYWGASYALERFTPYTAMKNAILDPSYKTQAASTLCPCANTAFTWTSFVDFFTIYYNASQHPIRTSFITNGSDFCMNTVRSYPLNQSLFLSLGCPNLINSIVDKTDSRTIMSSNSLMDPILLNSTIDRSVQSNLEKALNECVLLMSNATSWDDMDPFSWLRNIYEAFNAMLKLYSSNPHASDLDFWDRANGTLASSRSHVPLVQAIGYNLAVGMQINWTRYVEDCSPIYCDVVKGTSVGSKFFAALAQIGGFGALVLLVIRKIVWPLICFLCGWEN